MAKKKKKNQIDSTLQPGEKQDESIQDNSTPQPVEKIEIENIEAIVQEANREFFHPIGFNIILVDGHLEIEQPEKQPCLEYGADVKKEIANVKHIQNLRNITTKRRYKELGYKVQPVMIRL